MSRAFCYQCRRAKVACLCQRIKKQPNDIRVVVLQHPEEAKNPKGSAVIAELGLEQYVRYQGEDFTGHPEVQAILQEESEVSVVIYPDNGAKSLEQEQFEIVGSVALSSEGGAVVNLKNMIVIDGTWRKARKIWQLNPALHRLKCYRLSQAPQSQYRIRKVPEPDYLSTLECIVYALRVIEGRQEAYGDLLSLFDEMIAFQIQNMGEETYRKHHTHRKD